MSTAKANISEANADLSQHDADALAERAAQALYARDAVARFLGITLDSSGVGEAVMSMPIRRDMLNGFGACQGGLMFALADSAFAYACNSRNQKTVASSGEIEFLLPGKEGDTLRAHAVERSLRSRTGVYDITVSNQDGAVVALFRGRSYRVQGTVTEG